ncbi:hypothetical protein [Embleya sp. NPDC005575]|uniref:hypothetical protein n=1 Tax=Embleya sp. NPDC005575 TaxID=3156892 RepID=UPI0033A6460C
MRTRPHRIHLTAAMTAALLALGGLTACGGDGKSTPKKGGGGAKSAAGAFLDDVEKATAEKQSVQFSGTTSIPGASGGQSPNPQPPGSAGMPGGGKFEGRMSWAGGTNLSEITMGELKSVMTKDAAYINMKTPMMAGKTWMKTSTAGMAGRDAMGKLLADVVASGNPAKSLALLLQAGDLKEIGTEDRAGVRTRHFAGTVEFGKLIADIDANLTEADIETLRQQQAALGVTTEKIDVWIGPDKLITHVENHTQSDQGPMVFAGDYTNWGAKFDIAPPPADQVFDMGDLTKGLPNLPGMPSMPGMPSLPARR